MKNNRKSSAMENGLEKNLTRAHLPEANVISDI
jgi:hypothetical protein